MAKMRKVRDMREAHDVCETREVRETLAPAMRELLAPAGSMEALKAAVANGADAVYLGMKRFGARAYSANFDEQEVEEAVAYAHLRGVRVYVTVNTIAFENELPEIYQQLHFLNGIGVDGVIAQDLAVLTYVADHFEDMEAHCSTQMGIDDLEGALLAKELGAKRVVVSREVPVDEVKRIRREADLPVEIFVHGALCVSYSGNCIMSGMTGNRSGNRGRCIGSCRKLYDIFELDAVVAGAVDAGSGGAGAAAESAGGVSEGAPEGKLIGRNYILSTKDLNTIDHVDELEGIDSLKIEGRMKEPIYVANVISRYRMALDGRASREDKVKLNRTFNRTYTCGYLFGEDRGSITNVEKPNHHGYRIGEIVGVRKGLYEIALTDALRQNDLIRIRHKAEDVNLAASKIYDAGGRLINGAQAGETCFIRLKERLSVGDPVYKSKDIAYEKELESQLSGEFRRFPLNMAVYAHPGAPLVVNAEAFGLEYTYEGDEMLSEALKQPTTKDAVEKQLARLNDTIFALGEVEYEDCGAFVPAKMLNAARKDIVERMYELRLASKQRREKSAPGAQPLGSPVAFLPKPAYLTAAVATQEQYDACKEAGIETVYFQNVVPRNGANYRAIDERLAEGEEVLVGGMGGVRYFRGKRPFVADYSNTVVNAKSCRILHRLGAKRVTLSYEINEWQLRDLLASYREANDGSPALEMIVYGHAPLLVTKHCPLKAMGRCGSCRSKRYEIRDEFGSFPILAHENCDTTVLNGKVLNLLDEMPQWASAPDKPGIEAFRLNFTTESAYEVREVIAVAQAKLAGGAAFAFNPETDTRGYYNKEIM